MKREPGIGLLSSYGRTTSVTMCFELLPSYIRDGLHVQTMSPEMAMRLAMRLPTSIGTIRPDGMNWCDVCFKVRLGLPTLWQRWWALPPVEWVVAGCCNCSGWTRNL